MELVDMKGLKPFARCGVEGSNPSLSTKEGWQNGIAPVLKTVV